MHFYMRGYFLRIQLSSRNFIIYNILGIFFVYYSILDPYPDEKFVSGRNISGSRSKSINRNIRPNVWLDTDFDIQSETDFDIRLNNGKLKSPVIWSLPIRHRVVCYL